MAIYADDDANYLTRANPWGSAFGALTFCYWVKFTTLADWACPVSIDYTTDFIYFELKQDTNSPLCLFYKDAVIANTVGLEVVAAPSAGVWYFVCGVKTVGTSLVAYAGAASAASLATATWSASQITTFPNTFDISIGRNLAFTSENANGAMAHVKIWDAVLTAAEVERERWSARPRRTADLKAWYPLMGNTVAASLADYSGNDFALTQQGTPTVQDGPPVGWGAPPHLVQNPSLYVTWGSSTADADEQKLSWSLWQTAPTTPVNVDGNADYGQLAAVSGESCYSSVVDTQNATSKTFTVTKEKYGTSGAGNVTISIRGSDTSFAQHDGTPSWSVYTTPVTGAWRYVQLKIVYAA